jgi:hypothetical protein
MHLCALQQLLQGDSAGLFPLSHSLSPFRLSGLPSVLPYLSGRIDSCRHVRRKPFSYFNLRECAGTSPNSTVTFAPRRTFAPGAGDC